jgi:Mn-containing catalase
VVTKPDARFAQYMLEQFCGATGEFPAALLYWVRSFHVEDAGIRDMLQNVAIEEFSHLAAVDMLILQHSSGAAEQKAKRSTRFAVRGMGQHPLDHCGQAWSAACVHEDGNVMRDLRADIGAEAGARQTCEVLMKMAPDEGTPRAAFPLHAQSDAHPDLHDGAGPARRAGRAAMRRRAAG